MKPAASSMLSLNRRPDGIQVEGSAPSVGSAPSPTCVGSSRWSGSRQVPEPGGARVRIDLQTLEADHPPNRSPLVGRHAGWMVAGAETPRRSVGVLIGCLPSRGPSRKPSRFGRAGSRRPWEAGGRSGISKEGCRGQAVGVVDALGFLTSVALVTRAGRRGRPARPWWGTLSIVIA